MKSIFAGLCLGLLVLTESARSAEPVPAPDPAALYMRYIDDAKKYTPPTNGDCLVSKMFYASLNRPKPSLKRDDLWKLVESAPRENARAYYDHIAKRISPNSLEQIHYVFEGNSWRNESWREIAVFNGNSEAIYDKRNEQADLYPSETAHDRLRFENLRQRPVLTTKHLEPARFELMANRYVEARLKSETTESPPRTIESVTWMAPGGVRMRSFTTINGSARQEKRSYEIGRFRDDRLVPAITVNVQYGKDDVVYLLDIYYIDQGRFNVPLPIDSFEVAVPPETGVIDHRFTPNQPPRWFTKKEEKNVISFANDEIAKDMPKP